MTLAAPPWAASFQPRAISATRTAHADALRRCYEELMLPRNDPHYVKALEDEAARRKRIGNALLLVRMIVERGRFHYRVSPADERARRYSAKLWRISRSRASERKSPTTLRGLQTTRRSGIALHKALNDPSRHRTEAKPRGRGWGASTINLPFFREWEWVSVRGEMQILGRPIAVHDRLLHAPGGAHYLGIDAAEHFVELHAWRAEARDECFGKGAQVFVSI
jgi:hypothetical protein